MRFPVQVRLMRTLVDVDGFVSGKEKKCRGCEWFQSETIRCMEPKCKVCPASGLRFKPWESMPRCPENRW